MKWGDTFCCLLFVTDVNGGMSALCYLLFVREVKGGLPLLSVSSVKGGMYPLLLVV